MTLTSEQRTLIRQALDQQRRQAATVKLIGPRHSYRDGCRCRNCRRDHAAYMRHWYQQNNNAARVRARVQATRKKAA